MLIIFVVRAQDGSFRHCYVMCHMRMTEASVVLSRKNTLLPNKTSMTQNIPALLIQLSLISQGEAMTFKTVFEILKSEQSAPRYRCYCVTCVLEMKLALLRVNRSAAN